MDGSQIERGTLKAILARKELTIGSWLSFGFAPTCEILAKAGFDWLVVDMEHTAISVEQMFSLIQVTELCGVVPLVRVGENDALSIKRAMDAGAHGVVVPMVNSASDAERAVKAAYYPPAGTRGVGLSRAQDYGFGFETYRERAAAETVVIVQVEHFEAVENLGAIAGTEGVDAFIVGPYDLSGSLGFPGQWDADPVREALTRIEAFIPESPIPAGFHVVHPDIEALRKKVSSGYRFLAYGVDMVFLAGKVNEEAEAVRSISC